MTLFTLDIAEIVDLATAVAVTGAMTVSEWAGGDMFETLVGIATLVNETHPTFR